MIDFELGESLTALRDRVRAFVESEVIPREDDANKSPELADRIRRELQGKAERAGLFSPTDPRPFRIYDGPSEVHRASIARRVFRRLSPR
jgi:alkylation response protein AidB-like acyl-CoA dehydrogenase